MSLPSFASRLLFLVLTLVSPLLLALAWVAPLLGLFSLVLRRSRTLALSFRRYLLSLSRCLLRLTRLNLPVCHDPPHFSFRKATVGPQAQLFLAPGLLAVQYMF